MITISQWFCSCCLPGWKEFSIVSSLLSTPKVLPTHISHLLKVLFPDLPSLGSRTFPTLQPATSSIRPPALPSLGFRSISFFYNHTMLCWWVLYSKFIIMNFARPDIAFLSLQPSSVQINKDLGEFELIELIWTNYQHVYKQYSLTSPSCKEGQNNPYCTLYFASRVQTGTFECFSCPQNLFSAHTGSMNPVPTSLVPTECMDFMRMCWWRGTSFSQVRCLPRTVSSALCILPFWIFKERTMIAFYKVCGLTGGCRSRQDLVLA